MPERNTPSRSGDLLRLPVAGGTVCHAGEMACVYRSTGYTQPGAEGENQLRAVGRYADTADNSAGVIGGEIFVTIEPGIYRWEDRANGGASIALRDIGQPAYISGPDSVAADAATVANAARGVAGVIVDVDDDGVWVRTAV